MTHENVQVVDDEWITFPGGELEGERPKALCPACREQLKQAAAGQTAIATRLRAVCFLCYRAQLDRERALNAAGTLDTASSARFQCGLPFEPVNKPRLEMLKAERATARAARQAGVGLHEGTRRLAQIAARHALDAMAAGLESRRLAPVDDVDNVDDVDDVERDRMAGAIHAAELQLPESWLPFVVAR
jgi:hypothetical protein